MTSSIPSNWHRRRLRFDARLNPVKSELTLRGDTEVSFVPMDAVGEHGGLRLDEQRMLDDVYTGYTYFRDGDVVVAKITPCFENGKTALACGLVNGIGFGTTELHVLRASETLDARFLFYLAIAYDLRSYGEAEMLGAGGQKRVPERFFKDWRAALPSLAVQTRIAAFLDEKAAQIDALIEKKQQLLERLAEKRHAIITQAVTKGLDPSATMKDGGIDWLGQIPAHWELKRLRFLVRLHSGATPTTGASEYWDGDLNWISPKDMKRDVITETIDKVTDLAVDEYGLNCFSESNVVIVVRGMILAKTVPVAIAQGRYTINQDMKALVSNGKMAPEYLQMYLSAIRSFLMTLIAEAGHGTKALRTDVFVDTPTLIPPIDEQESIALNVQQQKNELDRLSDCVSKAISRMTEYRSSLITAAVTGQIEELC